MDALLQLRYIPPLKPKQYRHQLSKMQRESCLPRKLPPAQADTTSFGYQLWVTAYDQAKQDQSLLQPMNLRATASQTVSVGQLFFLFHFQVGLAAGRFLT